MSTAVLYFVAGVVGRFVVDYLDRAALGNLENVGRLELTHGVALAQVQVYFDAIPMATPTWCACGTGPWPADPAERPSSSGRFVLVGGLRHLELILAQEHREDRLDLHGGKGGADATVLTAPNGIHVQRLAMSACSGLL